MLGATFFHQTCPSCSRHLRIRLEHLGRTVTCQHCSRRFVATQEQVVEDSSDSSEYLLSKAEQLLLKAAATGRTGLP